MWKYLKSIAFSHLKHGNCNRIRHVVFFFRNVKETDEENGCNTIDDQKRRERMQEHKMDSLPDFSRMLNTAGVFVVLHVLLAMAAHAVSAQTYKNVTTGERAALIALYEATEGDNWLDNTGWKTPPVENDGFSNYECDWRGVICTSTGGDFENVRWLSLQGNGLRGTLPTELENFPALQYLYLYGNQLTGPIPSAVGSLPNLEWLDLSDNSLGGNIPFMIGDYPVLYELNLSKNNLDGSIPSGLGTISTLAVLDLSSNSLSGSIPASLGDSQALYYLDLSSNELSGSIPGELGGEPGVVPFLEHLDLSHNSLTGGIPAELGNIRVEDSELPVYKDLSYNSLDGSIPPELGNTTAAYLDLSNNSLSGAIPPELKNLPFVYYLDLSHNDLTGSIPSELAEIETLEELWLQWNQLEGSIPSALGELKNLEWLALFQNSLSGEIPSELGSMGSLEFLALYSNQLTGAIPAGLGLAPSLFGLYLGDNQLSGGFDQLVQDLNVSGTIKYLSVGGNDFAGCLPPLLGSLSSLLQLKINDNGFLSEVPSERIGLSLMENGSDFSNNFLFSTDPALNDELNSAQIGDDDWQSMQFEVPRVEPAGGCGGYDHCYATFAAAFEAMLSPSPVLAGQGS